MRAVLPFFVLQLRLDAHVLLLVLPFFVLQLPLDARALELLTDVHVLDLLANVHVVLHFLLLQPPSSKGVDFYRGEGHHARFQYSKPWQKRLS